MRFDRVPAILLAACALSFATPAARADCTAPGLRPIHTLAAAAAPGAVRVRGVVTAVFPGLDGYFIEASRSSWDRQTTTSEGLFVYAGHHPSGLAAGARAILAGRFQVFHGLPELAHARILKRCGKRALPPPVSLRLPLGREWGGLLGMRVRFARPLFVGDLDDFGRYGEVLLAADGRLYAPTSRTAPGPGAHALARAQAARSLWMDDGTSHEPASLRVFAGHRFDGAHPLRAGQALDQLTGIAYHAFGRDFLEPTGFRLDRTPNPRVTPESLGLPGGLRVVSFNVENYFNRALTGPPFPTERGARSAEDFDCQRAKLVAALAALRPALAGLQEIENNGYGAGSALASLVAGLNRAVPGAPYRYLRPATKRLGDGLIAPALVYDTRRLVPMGPVAVLDPSVAARRASAAVAVGLARPALAARFRLRGSGSDLRFTAAVVHLRSKRSACHDGLDSRSGAGYCAVARAAAVAALARWLESRPTGEPTHNVLILGDFNAYPKERAIVRLRSAGWVDLVARYTAAGTRYTESYRGRVGELDYIFANRAMARKIAGAAVWHNDADEARAFGYRGSLSACHGNAAPWRASDHDPVIVVLRP